MSPKWQVSLMSIVFFLLFIMLLPGCLFESDDSAVVSTNQGSVISQITELSSNTRNFSTSGGTLTLDEVAAVFPAASLPGDTQIKVAKVLVSNSKQDPSLINVTGTYVLAASNFAKTVELTNSANIEFKINPSGFDESSIRLVFWDGYNWHEVPAEYDKTRNVVSSTLDVLLPYGTRIYLTDPKKTQVKKTGRTGKETITEFVALKVVGVASGASGSGVDRQASGSGKAIYIKSANFTVKYEQAADKALAEAVSGYLENAYSVIVNEMGFKKPGKTALNGYGNTLPVIFTELGDAYGRADSTNFIEIQEGTETGDGLSHTCHHEFFHLVQYQTFRSAGNNSDDGMSWFDETTADAIGFYTMKGLGAICSADDAEMGSFEKRLDSDEYTITDNDDYEYCHFPFISYILRTYGHSAFKTFFETYNSNTPGKENINMKTIDTAAVKGFGKSISGRDGIYWDFYKDYFISGVVFNKDKFLNLAQRANGTPFEITEENKNDQGATLIGISAGASFQPMDFTLLRLSGQVALFRYTGTVEASFTLTINVKSVPATAGGRIQIVPFKRVNGVLQIAGTAVDVADGEQVSKSYARFGKDIHEIYVIMANTNSQADGYKVNIGATAGAYDAQIPATPEDIVGKVQAIKYKEFLTGLPVNESNLRGYESDKTPQAGTPLTRKYISERLSAILGAGNVSTQDFTTAKGYQGSNIIGMLPGKSSNPGQYIISAHYDSEQTPGADDDASGVAGVLEAARVLSDYKFNDSLIFVFFDLEEERDGEYAQGSLFYTQLKQGDAGKVKGMISLDMLAYHAAGDQYISLSRGDENTGTKSEFLMKAVEAAITKYSTLKTGYALTGENASDVVRFFNAGYAALLVSEHYDNNGWPVNPYYHKESDYYLGQSGAANKYNGSDYLDFDYASQIIKGVVGWASVAATPVN